MVNIFLYIRIGKKLIYNVFYNQLIYKHGKYVSIQKAKPNIYLQCVLKSYYL